MRTLLKGGFQPITANPGPVVVRLRLFRLGLAAFIKLPNPDAAEIFAFFPSIRVSFLNRRQVVATRSNTQCVVSRIGGFIPVGMSTCCDFLLEFRNPLLKLLQPLLAFVGGQCVNLPDNRENLLANGVLSFS